MKYLKKIIAGTLAISILGMPSVFAATYTVQSGDSYWKISQRYGVGLSNLMEANQANGNTALYVGDELYIPDSNERYYTVKSGDTPWLISQKLNVSLNNLLTTNHLNQSSIIYPGQRLVTPSSNTNKTLTQPQPYLTYESHTIQRGDTFWSLSQKYGLPMQDILDANHMTQNTALYVNQVIKIPVYHVPEMETLGPQYGEYLNWWEGVQYVIPIGSVIKVTDFSTGQSFMAKRTTGANHADVEALTAADTAMMKKIWGGSLSWIRRPVIVEYNGRRIAASVSSMPHAGNDNAPGGTYTTWRSDGYGAGMNYDYVKNNDMNGIFDIHFLNSTRHKDGAIDEKHQTNIKIAAGLIK